MLLTSCVLRDCYLHEIVMLRMLQIEDVVNCWFKYSLHVCGGDD